MVFVPVPGNIDATANPDVSMTVYMSNKFFQRGDASGSTNQPAVQSNT